jgi:hypothetical protein
MNMVDFGYALALVLIAMIVIARAYPLILRWRAGVKGHWSEEDYTATAREAVQPWPENELNVGRADGASPGYI